MELRKITKGAQGKGRPGSAGPDFLTSPQFERSTLWPKWGKSVGCCDSPWPTASGGNRENHRPSPPSAHRTRERSARVLYRKMQGSVLGWSLTNRPLLHNGGMAIRDDSVSTTAR